MSDDVDLYDDLPDLNFGESVCKINEERKYFIEQLDEKEAELHKTKERIAHLEKENKILEKNISSLYKTAINEIKRKDYLIEELRRGKESLIFRRNARQSHRIKSTTDINPHSFVSNFQASDLPTKHLTPVESTKSVLSTLVNNVDKKPLEFEGPGESSDVSFVCKSNVECLSSSLISDSVQEENGNTCSKVSDDSTGITPSIKACEMNSSKNTCENNSAGINDTLNGKLSSSSSQASFDLPLRSAFKQYSHKTMLPKNEKSSLTSDGRREKQKDYFGEYSCSSNRYRLPHNKHQSFKLVNERIKKEKSKDYHNRRKYDKDLNKETNFQEQKSNVGACVKSRRKLVLHSRSPSPQWSRRCSDRKSLNTKVKAQSDNVRMATQLKYKYSKTIHEKSVCRTPVKQERLFEKEKRLESSSKVKPLSPSLNVFPKQNLQDRIVSGKHNYESKRNNREQFTKTSTKCSRDILENNCNLILCPEKPIGYTIDPCNSVQRKENDPEISDNSSKTNTNGTAKKEESLFKFNAKMEVSKHFGFPKSACCSSQICRCKLFQSESEVTLIRNEKRACEKLPLQQLRTPPSENLIPLKVSPSEPAIVKENKFSFCVFNEQCKFQRSKRKRSVKLLVSEIKNVCFNERSKEANKTHCIHNVESGVAMEQIMDLCQIGNNVVLEQHMLYENNEIVHLKNQAVLNHDQSVFDKSNSDRDVNQKKKTVLNKDSSLSSDTEMLSTRKVSEVEVLKNKSPNKKRKSDSISDELKANLEKRNITSNDGNITDGNTNILLSTDESKNVYSNPVNKGKHCTNVAVNIDQISNMDMTARPIIPLIESSKKNIISKRRRKMCNLQDNIIQVISQVKSSLSSSS